MFVNRFAPFLFAIALAGQAAPPTTLLPPIPPAPLFLSGTDCGSGVADCSASVSSEFVVRLRTPGALSSFRASFANQFGSDPFAEEPSPDEPSAPRAIPLNHGRTIFLVRGVPPTAQHRMSNLAGMQIGDSAGDPNTIISLLKAPSGDGDFAQQCGLKTIRAETAWDEASPAAAANIRVAIVDSGIAKHRGLPVPASFVSDDDRNGHGTHVAGIVSAGENDGGTVGVVWNAQLYGYGFTDTDGRGTLACALAKLDDALHPVNSAGQPIPAPNIVVLAWGTSCASAILKQEITENPDVLFVVAAGNSNADLSRQPIYPAAFSDSLPNILTVMATDCDDKLTLFSSYGAKFVQLAAPGAGSLNTTCADACNRSPHGIISTVTNDRYCCMKGTSMAAGFVAGAAALVWSHMSKPTAAQVKQCLDESAVSLTQLSGKARFGRLDLRNAVDRALQPPSCNQ
jgi:subtilisin family serine protease